MSPKYIAIRQRGANISQAQIEAISKRGDGEIAVVDSDLPHGLELLEMKDSPKFLAFNFTIGLGWVYVGLILGVLYVVSRLA